MSSKTNGKVEVVVYVEDQLDAAGRSGLTTNLQSSEGIYTAEFCPLRDHLMLVQYDRERMNSQDVLRHVNANRVSARLIGPI